MQLNEKAGFLSQRTTREKLLAYLSAQARRAGSASFRIPFDRQQLADFLSVNRSAMSAELSRMQREGPALRRPQQLHTPPAGITRFRMRLEPLATEARRVFDTKAAAGIPAAARLFSGCAAGLLNGWTLDAPEKSP